MARIETPGPFKTGTGAANAMTTAASLTTERLKQQEQMQELGMYGLKKQALQVENAVALATAKTKKSEAEAKAAKARQEELLTKGQIEATRALGSADYELPLNPSSGTHSLYDALQNLDRQIEEGRAAGQDVTHYEVARGQLRAQYTKSSDLDNRSSRFVAMAAKADELSKQSGVPIPKELQELFDSAEIGPNGFPGSNVGGDVAAQFAKYQRQATAVRESLAERRRVATAGIVLQERLDQLVQAFDGADAAGSNDEPKVTSSPLYKRAQTALSELNAMDPDTKVGDMWGTVAQIRTDLKKLGDADLRSDGEKQIRFMDSVDERMRELGEMEEVSRVSDALEQSGSRSPFSGMADAHKRTMGGSMMSPYYRETLTTEEAANDVAMLQRVKDRRAKYIRETGKDISLGDAMKLMDREWHSGQELMQGAEMVLGLQQGDEDLMVDGTGDPMIIRNGESYTQSEAIVDDAYGWVLKGGEPDKYPNNSRAQVLMSLKPESDGTIEVTDQNRKALTVMARYGFVTREEEVGDDKFTISPQGRALGIDNPRRMLSSPAGQEVFRRMYRDMGTRTGHKYRDEKVSDRIRLTEDDKSWWPSSYYKKRTAEKQKQEAMRMQTMGDPAQSDDIQAMADGPFADPQAFDSLMASFEGPNWDMGEQYTPTSMEMAEYWQFQADAEQAFGPAPAEGMPAIPAERYNEISEDLRQQGWMETRVGGRHTGWSRSRGSFKTRERLSWSSPEIRERLGIPKQGFGTQKDAAGRKAVREANRGKPQQPLSANLTKAQQEELGQKLRDAGARVSYASRASGRIKKAVMPDGTVYDFSDPDVRLKLAQEYLGGNEEQQ